jgi:hypothetical protein
MQRNVNIAKDFFAKMTFALVLLGIMTLVIATPNGKAAENLSLTLNPSQGPPGTSVLTVITGFQAPTTLRVTFGTTDIRTITASMYSTLATDFPVPEVSPGMYTVTVTSSAGNIATATFIVTQALSPTPSPEGIPTEAPEETPVQEEPTSQPIIESNGFWSPLTIGIVIVAAVATTGLTTLFYMRRRKQEPLLTLDNSPYKPKYSPQESTTYKTGKSPGQTPPYSYRQSVTTMKPAMSSRENQFAANTKVCKHCKQNVREDLNVCPYCYKRLR